MARRCDLLVLIPSHVFGVHHELGYLTVTLDDLPQPENRCFICRAVLRSESDDMAAALSSMQGRMGDMTSHILQLRDTRSRHSQIPDPYDDASLEMLMALDSMAGPLDIHTGPSWLEMEDMHLAMGAPFALAFSRFNQMQTTSLY